MAIRAPKIPMNFLLFLIGAVCITGLKILTTPMITSANVNMETYKRSIIYSMNSCGELIVGDDVVINTKDMVILAEKIAEAKRRIEQIKEEE